MSRSLVFSILACVLLAVFSQRTHAQSNQTPNILKLDDPANTPAAKIADLAWMEGTWRGKLLGADSEETWTAPLGNSIMGMFRMVRGGKIVFSEHITIMEENGSLIQRLKHFHADMKGWEEKDESVEFPLVKLNGSEVYFSGMTYRKIDEETLHVYVAMKRRDGSVSEVKGEMRRVK